MEHESLSIGIVPSSAPDWRDICQSRNHSRLFMRFLLSTHWGQLCEFAFHFMIGELKKGSCVCLLAKLLGLHLPGWGSRGKMSGEVEGDIFHEGGHRVPRIAPIEVPVPFQGTLVKHHKSPGTLSKTDNRRRAFGGGNWPGAFRSILLQKNSG